MKSIRAALATRVCAGGLVVAVAVGFALSAVLEAALEARFDEALVSRARAIGSLLEEEAGEVQFEFPAKAWPEYLGGAAPEYFQIRIEARRLVLRSPTLRVEGKPADLPRGVDASGAPAPSDLRFPDGRTGRTVGVSLPVARDLEDVGPPSGASAPGAPPPMALVTVARARDALDRSLAELHVLLLAAGGLLVLGGGAVVAYSVRRGLAPLDVFADEVARIDASTLSLRVSADGAPRELLPMVEKLNELLARIGAAFERERRMTGNLAHELRTPIAELRAAADLARRWPDDGALTDAAVETADAVSVRMQEIVCGLLRLARITSGEDAPSREEVRLRPLVERLWTAFRAPAAARGLRLEDRTPPELCLRTDRTLLSVVITNLLDNAVRYAPPGSTIVSAVEVDAAGGVRWTLENGVGDLGPADVPRLAEPFWQKDHARSRPDHAGLGLSLVREVAQVLGGEVTFAVDGVFLVSLVLPPES